jgi:Fe-S cluster assembly protein SufD
MIDRFAELVLSQLSLNSSSFPLLQDVRSQGSDRLNHLPFPTSKDEEWRNANFTELFDQLQDFKPNQLAPIPLQDIIAPHILPECSVITFIDGKFAPKFSAVNHLPAGAFVGSLQNLINIGIDLTAQVSPYLDRYGDRKDFFTALNTASLEDVAVIYLPKDCSFTDPVQVIFAADQAPISQPRCLVILESGSSLNLVETYIGQEFWHFCNCVTEIYLGENSHLNHSKVQRESTMAIWISQCATAQQKSSSYTKNSVVIGAKKSRDNLHIHHLGEFTDTKLNGLTLIGGDQFADTHSAIAHNFANGTSQQLHKCIASGRSHGIFNGKILVAKNAQLTNSKQLSRNLLLSPKARIDTKPQLEIFADNVKCAHGATVSQIEADELFYLQSRCIDLESAKQLLTYAFAAEVITQIPIASLRENLNQFVTAKTMA